MTEPLDALLGEIGPEEAFRTLAELFPDAAVFAVDGERNVIHWSDGAEKLLGFTREEAMGRLCLSSIRCRTCTIGCGIAKHRTVSGFPLELYRADERWVPTKKYAKGFFRRRRRVPRRNRGLGRYRPSAGGGGEPCRDRSPPARCGGVSRPCEP